MDFTAANDSIGGEANKPHFLHLIDTLSRFPGKTSLMTNVKDSH